MNMNTMNPIQKADYEKVLLYQRVFSTPDGMEVLKDILGLLGLNATITTLEQAAMHNVALVILANMGVLRKHNDDAFVEALINLPYSPPTGDKESIDA